MDTSNEESKPSVAIAVIDHAGVTKTTKQWWHKAKWDLAVHGYPTYDADVSRSAMIGLSRSMLTTAFWIHSDLDVLVMVDHDIRTSDPSDLRRLVELCCEERCVAGALHPKRGFGHGMVGNTFEGGSYSIGKGGSVIPMKDVGAGLVAIHRDVLDSIHRSCIGLPKDNHLRVVEAKDKDFGTIISFWQDFIDDDCVWRTEDYSFCSRARYAGCKILADTTIYSMHTGDHEFTPLHSTFKLPDQIGATDEDLRKFGFKSDDS